MPTTYRVTVFGRPRGPWRQQRKQAQRDAIELGMGEYDEWGRFFVTVPADIEFRLGDEFRLSASVGRGGCTSQPGQALRSAGGR